MIKEIDTLIPKKNAIITQIIIEKINSIVLEIIEPITNISLGNIALHVRFFKERKTRMEADVLFAKCVYWIIPISR